MAILKIAKLGHPVLRAVAREVPVDQIASPEIQRLIDDMIETCHEYDGAGLAAPQVHQSLRIILCEVGENPRYPDAEAVPQTVIVNPVLALGGETEADWEGCLSLGGLRGLVTRSTEVTLEGFDRNGERLNITTGGFFAKVLQHETDHLDGLLFPDRMERLISLSFLDEQARYHSLYEQALRDDA